MSNADYIEELTLKNLGLQNQLRQFQEMFSATCLMLMDDKGKVRINAQILNRVKKIQELAYDGKTREDGSAINYRIAITMQEK